MNVPEITVVVVTWNAKDYVIRCLDSLELQSMNKQVEILVVDNASTDGVQACVRNAHGEVLLIQNTRNLGFARANNIGIAKARGRYVCLINSDVELFDHDALRRLWQTAEDHGCYAILGPRILNADGTSQQSVFNYPRPGNLFMDAIGLHHVLTLLSRIRCKYSLDRGVCPVNAVSGCFLLVRTKVIRSIGSLDERFFFYGEDIDLCKRISDAGWHVGFVPAVEVVHYGGVSSSRAALHFYKRLIDAKLIFWRKHWPRVVWLLRSLLVLHLALRCALHGMIILLVRSTRYKARRYVRSLYYVIGKAKGL